MIQSKNHNSIDGYQQVSPTTHIAARQSLFYNENTTFKMENLSYNNSSDEEENPRKEFFDSPTMKMFMMKYSMGKYVATRSKAKTLFPLFPCHPSLDDKE